VSVRSWISVFHGICNVQKAWLIRQKKKEKEKKICQYDLEIRKFTMSDHFTSQPEKSRRRQKKLTEHRAKWRLRQKKKSKRLRKCPNSLIRHQVVSSMTPRISAGHAHDHAIVGGPVLLQTPIGVFLRARRLRGGLV